VAGETEPRGIKERLSRQGEEALGRVAEELAANPIVTSAIAGAFEARERAVAAQEAAMGALGIPSAADIERLTRRVRSVSQRLEGIEDGIDRIDERVAGTATAVGLDARLEAIENQLAALAKELHGLHAVIPGAKKPVSPRQERLKVSG